ncbi:MAG: glucose-6-phosphate isomerase [Pseudomonadota bacterium]
MCTDYAHKLSLRVHDIAQRLHNEIECNKLPFITMSYAEKLLEELDALTPYIRRFSHMVVLGVGGSALGAKALQKAFFPQQDWPKHDGPWLWVADNVDTASMEALLTRLDPQETIVVTISKSGGTLETIAQYFLFCQWLKDGLGDVWHEHLLLITDEHKGFLRDEVRRHGVRSLTVPDNLGGRYSALSAVGLVPALFMGMDWKALLFGAMSMGRTLAEALSESAETRADVLATHPAWQLALWHCALMERGYNQLIFFTYAPKWASFGPWFAQLWAESIGKDGKGSMPLPAVGVTDQHSIQQMFLDGPRDKACMCITSKAHVAQEVAQQVTRQVAQRAEGHGSRSFPNDMPDQWTLLRGKCFGHLLQAETLGARMAMHQSAVPLVTLDMADLGPHAAGRFMMLLELMTVLTGWLLDMNPLDQPAVELGKRLANAELLAMGAAHKADLAPCPTMQALHKQYTKELQELHTFRERKTYTQEF